MRARFVPLLALLLGGCATSAQRMAPPAPDRPWSPSVDRSGDLTADPRKGHAAAPTEGYVLPANPAAAAMAAAPAIDSAKVYGLADLIDLAEQTNPETRIAWNEARNAALAAGIARSTYLPRLTATALGGYETHSGHASALGLSAEDRGSLTGTVSTLSLQWLLFDFGKREALVQAADQGTVIADIGFTAAHQKLIHVVSLAFYAYAAARARADSSEASLKDARDVQTAAEARKAQGVGTIIEVAQARQFTAQAELAKVRANGDVSDAYVTLLSAIGIPPLTSMRIADISDQPLPDNLDKPIDQVLSGALARRPDVLAAIAAQKAANAGVKAAKAEFMPKVFVSASGSYTSGNIDVTALPGVGDQSPTVNLSNHRWGATVLGGVTIPLYDAGVRDAMLAQARDRAASATETLDRAKLGASQEVVMANSKLRTSIAAVAATKALLDASQTTYDAALAAFRHGVGSSTDMLAAERQLLEARDAAADAHSATLSAAATLALACGVLGKAPQP
ncbi:TolC family protein [Sphingomonas sp. PR090111-T3T-6A]|uniref:TolC family protein n=1 Tax=Sphingomonas sp. PR090111-T3T-6A TaxID=685778 RepID=UPI000475B7E2|nr:TolC family protein [Sphingomonas sp. PR090111-T3T-6A]